jgi:hypothetical protein
MTDDPRVQRLNAVAAQMITDHKYDPHFAGMAERIDIETRLFLARCDALRELALKDMLDLRSQFSDERYAVETDRKIGFYTQVDGRWIVTPPSTEKLRATAIAVMHYCAGTPQQD